MDVHFDLATNIAETGITIPDITCVIDTGKHREMRYDDVGKHLYCPQQLRTDSMRNVKLVDWWKPLWQKAMLHSDAAVPAEYSTVFASTFSPNSVMTL